MIDKVTPQRLNSDIDSRHRPSTDMIDALNVAFNESFKSNSAAAEQTTTSDFSGDSGVVKPMPSNRSIEDIFDIDSQINDNSSIRVIGSVTDDVFNVIYFFVWSDNADQMGVWAWDQDAILPGNDLPGSYIRVYTSEKFNFPSNGFVKGDVVHIGQREDIGLRALSDISGSETDNTSTFSPATERVRNVLLYFTDNRNEPKKLDVFKVMQQNLDLYNDLDILDMITACPRTPIDPITFDFDFDSNRKVSNFSNLPGLQFAYQYVYKDNVESAISTYSKIAVPPAYIDLGVVTSSPNLQNRCVLTIPQGTREVLSIRILVRYGNIGIFRLVDEIQNSSVDSPFFEALGDITYNFYNDRVLVPISEDEVNMQYSNLPRVAQAQSVVSDRLIYGNYVEQYPEHNVAGNLTPIYHSTPKQGVVFNLTVSLNIQQYEAREFNPGVQGDIYKNLGTNRTAGVRILTSSIPDNLDVGTEIQVSFTMVADRNFHFYNQHNSYHGSRESDTYYDTGEDLDNINDGGFDDEFGFDIDFPGTPDSNNINLYKLGRRFFGKNTGVKLPNQTNKWKYKKWVWENFSPFSMESTEDEFDCSYGTSAANPLIIHSEPLNFKLTFVTQYDTNNGRIDVRDAIYSIFGEDPSLMPTESGLAFANQIDFLTNTTSSYSFNLNLSNGEKIKAETNTDYRKQLICAVGRKYPDTEPLTAPMPEGFFIVDKADVTFGLKPMTYMNDQQISAAAYLALDIRGLENVSVKTCIPFVDARARLLAHAESTNQDYVDESTEFFGQAPVNIINCNIAYWRVFNREFIQENDVVDILNYDVLSGGYANPYNNFFNPNTLIRNLYYWQPQHYDMYAVMSSFGANDTYNWNDLGYSLAPGLYHPERAKRSVGYLAAPSGNIAESLQLINTSGDIFNYHQSSFDSDDERIVRETCVFSVIDGEGGPGWAKNKTGFGQNVSWGSITPFVLFRGDIHRRRIIDRDKIEGLTEDYLYLYYPLSDHDTITELWETQFDYGQGALYFSQGIVKLTEYNSQNQPWTKTMGFLENFHNDDVENPNDSFGNESFSSGSNLVYHSDSFSNRNTWVEIESISTYIVFDGGDYYPRSFKTNANHDFGVVYYDQRGRSGYVNYLGSVFVNGYSIEDRNDDERGRVDIQVQIINSPPSWAVHYQIVYASNSTIQDFIQYTTGPAFIKKEFSTDEESLIYVSLAHIQGVNDISYTNIFGAVNKDGGKELYSYSEGDKLRILYYHDFDEDPVYPVNFVFDVVGVITLPSSKEDNILSRDTDTAEVNPVKTGQFIILKDNPQATGFSYADIAQSENQEGGYDDGRSPLNFWGNRTVVEIFSPKKIQDFDQRLYYEIGEKYNIVPGPNNTLVHEQTNILLQDGDVWWRKVPLNVQRFSSSNQEYVQLQRRELNDELLVDYSFPRFKPYYLETMAFTDVISGCNQFDWGKPKVIVPLAQSLYKRSSLTYSNKNNYVAKSNNFTLFNASLLNFKNLPNEYGAVNYILNDYDNALVIQENKTSSIPVSRNIITTAGGDQSLVASTKVLGTQKFYAGDYGCDNNPESVVRAGENVYFAHKNKKEVYKFSRSKGIKVISKINMKSYFNNIFNEALNDEANGEGIVRVVGGFDPLRDEFILSVHNMRDFTEDEIDYDVTDDVFDDYEDEDHGGDDVSDDRPCAKIVTTVTELTDLDKLQPGDQFTIQYTFTNEGDGIGSFANDFFSSYPFYQQGQPSVFMFGNWDNFVVQDPTAFVFSPQPTYDPDNGQISIMNQDPNITLTTEDLGYTTIIQPPLSQQLASYYPESIAAAPGGVALLFPGNSMFLTVTYQVPMNYSPGDYNFNVQFNFASYDVDAFNQGFNLNPDFGAGGATRYFAIVDCYHSSKTIIHTFTVDKPERPNEDDSEDDDTIKPDDPTIPQTGLIGFSGLTIDSDDNFVPSDEEDIR